MSQGEIIGSRFVEMATARQDAAEDGSYRFIGSTTAPCMVRVDRGGKSVEMAEILSHEPGAADTTGFKSVLFNHNRNVILGKVNAMDLDGERSIAAVSLLESANLGNGVTVREAVDSGALAGVSMGFRYRPEDCEVDWDARTIRVGKWRAMELSLTPVPEDVGASTMRSVDLSCLHPEPDKDPAVLVPSTRSAAMDPVIIPTEPAVAPAPAPAPVDPSTPSLDDIRDVSRMAEDHGLRASDFLTLPKADALAKILDAVKERSAEEHPAPTQAPGPSIRMLEDSSEKAERAAEEFQINRSFGDKFDNHPFAGRRVTDAARRFATMLGIRGAMDWSEKDAAAYALGDLRNMSSGARSAANISTASFATFINLNAITKVVARGFEQNTRGVNYDQWTERQVVPDFKQFSIGGLGTGNLIETAENVALPELAKSEGVYNSTAKLWGGTLSLSIQALINDDTREFDRSLRQAGAIAQKTINKRVYEKLLGKTWTNNTTVGTIVSTSADTLVAARANLDAVISAMLSKTGKDGNPLSNMPSFLIVPPAQITTARSIVGPVQPGQVNGANQQLTVIESAWLSASVLTGNSTTSYYLVCDPNEATAGVVSFIRGYESVQVDEYDAMAVAAKKWKVWLPFEADIVDFGGLIFGAHRGTAA